MGPLLGERLRSRRLLGLLVAVPLALACSPLLNVGSADAGQVCRGSSTRPTAGNVSLMRSATLCLINHDRATLGMPALRRNGQLRRVAQYQVSEMLRWDYFSDTEPSGRTPASLVHATGYVLRAASVSVGEDIGWGTGSESTPSQLVAGWMRSPPHRAIILGGYREIGIGVAGAVPYAVGHGLSGATYAIELGARWF